MSRGMVRGRREPMLPEHPFTVVQGQRAPIGAASSHRESPRDARSARIAAQVESALAEAAAVAAALGDWADFELPAEDDEVDALLPLEFQLADLERAVDSMLEARDRFLQSDEPRGSTADASFDPGSRAAASTGVVQDLDGPPSTPDAAPPMPRST